MSFNQWISKKISHIYRSNYHQSSRLTKIKQSCRSCRSLVYFKNRLIIEHQFPPWAIPGDEFLVLVPGFVQLALKVVDVLGTCRHRFLSLQMLRFGASQLLGNTLLGRNLVLKGSGKRGWRGHNMGGKRERGRQRGLGGKWTSLFEQRCVWSR